MNGNLLPLRFSDYAEDYIEPQIDDEDQVRLVNLTPHIIRLVLDQDGEQYPLQIDIPPTGQVARREHLRVVEERITIDSSRGPQQVSIFRNVYLDIVDLPPQLPGVKYIVSQIAATGLDRDDLLVVEDVLKDEFGRPSGCRAFAKPREALKIEQEEVDVIRDMLDEEIPIDLQYSEYHIPRSIYLTNRPDSP